MHRESMIPVLTPRALAAPRYWVPVDDEDLWCIARVESRAGGSVKLSRSRGPAGCVYYIVYHAGITVRAWYGAGAYRMDDQCHRRA